MFSKQGQFYSGLARELRRITRVNDLGKNTVSQLFYHVRETVLSKIIPKWCIAGTFLLPSLKGNCRCMPKLCNGFCNWMNITFTLD